MAFEACLFIVEKVAIVRVGSRAVDYNGRTTVVGAGNGISQIHDALLTSLYLRSISCKAVLTRWLLYAIHIVALRRRAAR